MTKSSAEPNSSPGGGLDIHFARQFRALRSDHSLRLDNNVERTRVPRDTAKLKALQPLEKISSQRSVGTGLGPDAKPYKWKRIKAGVPGAPQDSARDYFVVGDAV